MAAVARTIGAAIVLGTLGAGCASSDDPSTEGRTAARPTATASSPEAAAPPTLEQRLRGVPRESPEATVLTLYYYAQWGNYPGIVRLYDRRVRRTIGSAQIASVYSLNRDGLALMKPKVVDTRKTRDGMFVAVELTRPDAAPVYDSFLLRQAKVGWGIGYDTFFDRAYGEYARLGVDGPLRTKPTRDGLLAARNASAQFRDIFLPGS